MEPKKRLDIATIVVRGNGTDGGSDASDFRPVSPPIHHSVAYGYETMKELDDVFAGNKQGYCYSRFGNPTVHQFEKAMAAVEGGEACVAFSSGMAAIHGCYALCCPGAGGKVLASRDLYGPTYISLRDFCQSRNVALEFTDISDLGLVERRLKELRPAFMIVETISNPLVQVADLNALGRLARTYGAALIVDNTFATPVLCRPLECGAHIVVHSATKFISGHGDVSGGVVVTDAERAKRLSEIRKMTGAILGPQDAWLLGRSLRTLFVRVERQQENARYVASWLKNHPRVEKVHFPGLSHHPQHALADKLFGSKERFGSVLAFEIKGAGKNEVFSFCDKLKLCIPVTTVGDIFTLVLCPAFSSHRGMTPEERSALGIKDNLVRMSVGIEDKNDICADLSQALEN